MPMQQKDVPFQVIIFVCTNVRDEDGRVSCAGHGRCGAILRDKLKAEVAARGLKGKVRVSASGCMDVCEEGPNVMVFDKDNQKGVWYNHVAENDIQEILEKHCTSKDNK
jgi:(2Fe-2S) ferredoxin